MDKDFKIKTAFKLYSLAWRGLLPILKGNKRFSAGWSQRLSGGNLPAADIWIQAASVGESYLAREILDKINPSRRLKVLLTTNTAQGMGILESFLKDKRTKDSNSFATAAYFPFDSPFIMKEAVRSVRPKGMVLLETELWPSLLNTLKEHDSKIFVVNGRITEKSLNNYMKLPWLWDHLAPDHILAITEDDAERFRLLFPSSQIGTMSNIKFDRLRFNTVPEHDTASLEDIVESSSPFVVLASIRQKEEKDVERIVAHIKTKNTSAVIGLFPRHKQRIKAWEEILTNKGHRWELRSNIKTRVSKGTVILWDKFGELTSAYSLATSAFVGGTLKPLGGQNFLEAVSCGLVPVIGPYWNDFFWVGEEIFHLGLVRQASSWKEVVQMILNDLNNPPFRSKITAKGFAYIKERQGGTDLVCRLIENVLF